MRPANTARRGERVNAAIRNRRLGLGCGVLVASLLLAVGGLSLPSPAVAAGASLRIDPVAGAVGKGATFTAKVIANSEVAMSGAQATVKFDPALLQVTTVAKGVDFANAPILTGAGDAAITAANASGSLTTVAAAYLPPGSVPAGDRQFLVITFKAIACGQSTLGLPVGAADAGLLDGRAATYGHPVTVTAVAGAVTVSCAPLPTPVPAARTPKPTRAPRTQPRRVSTPAPIPVGVVAGDTAAPIPGMVSDTPGASPSADASAAAAGPVASDGPTGSPEPFAGPAVDQPISPAAHRIATAKTMALVGVGLLAVALAFALVVGIAVLLVAGGLALVRVRGR
jgi:hypothetical protein